MSYRQHFSKSITLSKTVSVSYPKSESGGSQSVTVQITEPLEFVIDVDTTPVDKGLSNCKLGIAGINSALVVGSNAQISEKNKGAEKVSTTLINEFNNYISSEISQDMESLKHKLLAANGQMAAEFHEAERKHIQFKDDYRRIKERYSKLFETLNRELENRIRSVDGPIFSLVRDGFSRDIGTRLCSGLAHAGTTSDEGLKSSQSVEIAHTKQRALSLIGNIKEFLHRQKKLEAVIESLLGKETVESRQTLLLPCVLQETNDLDGFSRNIFCQDNLKAQLNASTLIESENSWRDLSQSERNELLNLVNQRFTADDEELNSREIEYIQRFFSGSPCLTNEQATVIQGAD